MRRSSVVRTTCNSFRVRRFVHPVQIGCQRYYARAVQPETAPKLFTKSKSSIVEPEELLFCNDNAGKAGQTSPKQWQQDTELLTSACQKQVNYWHKLHPLTDQQIALVKKIAKLAILNRRTPVVNFMEILNHGMHLHRFWSDRKETSLDMDQVDLSDLVYLTAQTMFRNLPLATPQWQTDIPVFGLNMLIRRRLFYVGLLAGHVRSALALWGGSMDDKENDLILRCLDNASAKTTLDDQKSALIQLVRADAAGDITTALAICNKLLELDKAALDEYEWLWMRRNNWNFEQGPKKIQEKGISDIWDGRGVYSAPLIFHALEKFCNRTIDKHLKVRFLTHLVACSHKHYGPQELAEAYQDTGDVEMAREWHEIAAALGNRESREWLQSYLTRMVTESNWWNRRERIRQLQRWKELGPGWKRTYEKKSPENDKRS